jgi:hypothetical protein
MVIQFKKAFLTVISLVAINAFASQTQIGFSSTEIDAVLKTLNANSDLRDFEIESVSLSAYRDGFATVSVSLINRASASKVGKRYIVSQEETCGLSICPLKVSEDTLGRPQ